MSEILEGIKTEIEELVAQGVEVKQQIEEYRDEAIAIDEDFKARNEHRNHIPLDDLPYGEEILRTERLPAEIDEAIDKIESIDLDKSCLTEVVDILQEVRRVIECAFHAIRPPSPPTSGHLFHAHPARQSERSDAGLHC